MEMSIFSNEIVVVFEVVIIIIDMVGVGPLRSVHVVLPYMIGELN